jgi:hypothetical protein
VCQLPIVMITVSQEISETEKRVKVQGQPARPAQGGETVVAWNLASYYSARCTDRGARVFAPLPIPGVGGSNAHNSQRNFANQAQKPHFLSAALWWYQFAFFMPGIDECNPPVPEGPFPLSQNSRAQGLQRVGQPPVQRPVRAVKRRRVEAIVPQAREELPRCSRR